MDIDTWIQLGVFIVTAIGIIAGGIIAFLRYTRVIKDIEERQKLIDETAERNICILNDLNSNAQTMATHNKQVLIGLCICIGILLLVDPRIAQRDKLKQRREQKNP